MQPGKGRVIVRPRLDDDLAACELLARTVHDTDGYPAFVRNDDFRRFVASPDALAAWVGEDNGEIVGHVALHPTTTPPAMALASSRLGVDESRLGVIARLIVAPDARRRGTARSLLKTAVASARKRRLVPILDVVTRHTAAVALYETTGWKRLGVVDFSFPNGATVEEIVYAAPP